MAFDVPERFLDRVHVDSHEARTTMHDRASPYLIAIAAAGNWLAGRLTLLPLRATIIARAGGTATVRRTGRRQGGVGHEKARARPHRHQERRVHPRKRRRAQVMGTARSLLRDTGRSTTSSAIPPPARSMAAAAMSGSARPSGNRPISARTGRIRAKASPTRRARSRSRRCGAWRRRTARLYAGVEPAGLFRSDDGGETWSHVAGCRNIRRGRTGIRAAPG